MLFTYTAIFRHILHLFVREYWVFIPFSFLLFNVWGCYSIVYSGTVVLAVSCVVSSSGRVGGSCDHFMSFTLSTFFFFCNILLWWRLSEKEALVLTWWPIHELIKDFYHNQIPFRLPTKYHPLHYKWVGQSVRFFFLIFTQPLALSLNSTWFLYCQHCFSWHSVAFYQT